MIYLENLTNSMSCERQVNLSDLELKEIQDYWKRTPDILELVDWVFYIRGWTIFRPPTEWIRIVKSLAAKYPDSTWVIRQDLDKLFYSLYIALQKTKKKEPVLKAEEVENNR